MHRPLRRTTARLASLLAVGVAALGMGAGVAWAHAEVVATYPSASAPLSHPTHISVTFSEPVDLIPRALTLTTDLGVPVALDNAKLGAGGRELRANLQDRAAPGQYAAGWRVRADDGHVESGSFHFRVTGSTAPMGGTGDRPTLTSTAPLDMPEQPGEPLWPVLVAAGLAVVAGAGAALVVRRGLRAIGAAEPLYPSERISAASRGDHAPSSD